MGSVDAYGPSSQTLTFLDPEESDLLAAGADTQVWCTNLETLVFAYAAISKHNILVFLTM